jgi:eukaryotic-like serine/threonine-protein kinase
MKDARMPRPTDTDSREDSQEIFPQTFGRYVLVERIGAGGMAEIFRALTVGTEGFRRVLVVKRIRKSLDASPEFLRMFFDEAKISALLNHPYIVQIYDFGQIEGAYFLAMEHVQGRDLGNVMRKLSRAGQKIDPSLAALIAHQIAQGLHYAHTLQSADGQAFNIVHRDINPSNVMLLRTGIVKILDFGIAKASAAAGKAQTRHTVIKGKLGYLSPEQARCEVLDGRSDVFSLGTTLWEMLLGQRLFAGASDFERIRNVLEAPITPPSQRRPQIPAELERIVMRALERDRTRRYQSAEEMADDLEAFLRQAPAESQAIKKLLSDLYEGETLRNTVSLPALDLQAPSETETVVHSGGTDPNAAVPVPAQGVPSAPLPTMATGPLPRTGTTTRALPPQRRSALAWTGGASLLIAAAVITMSAVRSGPGAHVTGLGTSSASGSVAAGSADVRIEVNSEPAGATVRSSRGMLGTTPFVVTLPASSEVEHLRFEKPGFEPQIYEVRPRSAAFVFVELQPTSIR